MEKHTLIYKGKEKNRDKDIVVEKSRVHNLRDVSVSLPRNKLIVATGLSGSGKSSLAFDTLYAEGQRRYVESLSAYARQFLGRLQKPDCDKISGIPPAIAIEQKVNTRNPRSTVGTSTEIYDYMRLLYGRIGKTISPVTGLEVKHNDVEDVIGTIMAYPEDTRVAIGAPIRLIDGRTLETQLEIYSKAGYSRVIGSDGTITAIEDVLDHLKTDNKKTKCTDDFLLLIDRTVISSDKDEISRISESIETAFFEGQDNVEVLVFKNDGEIVRHQFSKRFESDGITFMVPNEQMFNFNNPYGACPTCEGFGKTVGIAPDLVIPNPELSVYEGAVACWKGEKMTQWKNDFVRIAPRYNFPIHRPYKNLTDEEKHLLWHGNAEFPGIYGFFRWIETQQHKIQYRIMLARYRGKTVCPECHGARLRKEASYVKVAGRSITELVTMPVESLYQWFKTIELNDQEKKIASRLLVEIINRLGFLVNVGLGYLTLDRLSNSLSGGESQRINLATSLGSSLVGSLYILDEPSIGLHSRDTERLIGVLRDLQKLGNTVLVVEHDEDIMRSADYIIDVGPEAGVNGGRIVYEGEPEGLKSANESYTMKYLNGSLSIPVPKRRRKSNSFIEIKGAYENNLKNLDVRFPLNVLTAVTGVSGSGKSTLVRDILYRAMVRQIEGIGDAPGKFAGLSGDYKHIGAIEFVDQNPIGKSTRSNPATYLKAYDEIRYLFADQQVSKQMGFTPTHFSFNTEGGRCEECKGEGTITIEMQFMSDITVECEECHGQRFKKEILEVKYKGKNINDVLNMSVDEAIEFFGSSSGSTEKRIVERLRPLADVGLGYIKLGQSSATLSGGENQRVKLAYFLSREKISHTLFIFDEPTTGLHFHDINKLMESINRLIDNGHSVILIEHNLDVIKCADHVIDIGPEGGDKGGEIVAIGTPEQIAESSNSYTGKYLKAKLR
ncbi:MAG: excinuclease ABC subunit UvrA [Muribaculaceae bacterium]|nr:excinuclease ABC subunit UvrA [Muribaculaceae bacterium]